MFLEILFGISIGCLLGVVCGLFPGLHVNLLAAIILSMLPFLSAHFPIFAVAVGIVAMSVTYAFVDFIPTIFLGAPSEGTFFAALPGSELLAKGLGFDAVRLAVLGCFLSLVLMALISPLLLLMVPVIFSFSAKFTWLVLILLSGALILWQKGLKAKVWGFFVFVLSGALGAAAFSIKALNEPLLPMLSGLFGVSLLVANINAKVTLPRQYVVEAVEIKVGELLKTASLSLVSGCLVGIFPALGPAHSAAVATRLFGNGEKNAYLVLIGGISSVSMAMGLITAYSIAKARNGSIVAVQSIVGDFNIGQFAILMAVAVVSGCVAVFLTMAIARFFAASLSRIDYRKVSLSVILIVFCMVAVFSGFTGLIVLAASTAVGLIPMIKGVNRSCAMGCIIVPVLAYYI